MTEYATINDVADDVRIGLGEFADEFDYVAIAREVAEWRDGKLVAPLLDEEQPNEEYNEICRKHDIQNARSEWEEHGEGWYEIDFSDGGMFGDGCFWCDTLEDLMEEMKAAGYWATETHIPSCEWLGYRKYTVTVCNGEAEFVNETFDDLEKAQGRFEELKGTFPFNDSDEMLLLMKFDNGTQVSIDEYDGEDGVVEYMDSHGFGDYSKADYETRTEMEDAALAFAAMEQKLEPRLFNQIGMDGAARRYVDGTASKNDLLVLMNIGEITTDDVIAYYKGHGWPLPKHGIRE